MFKIFLPHYKVFVRHTWLKQTRCDPLTEHLLTHQSRVEGGGKTRVGACVGVVVHAMMFTPTTRIPKVTPWTTFMSPVLILLLQRDIFLYNLYKKSGDQYGKEEIYVSMKINECQRQRHVMKYRISLPSLTTESFLLFAVVIIRRK